MTGKEVDITVYNKKNEEILMDGLKVVPRMDEFVFFDGVKFKVLDVTHFASRHAHIVSVFVKKEAK